MTFSICVREQYNDENGTERTRYGVAVTTRLPSVGSACPFVSEAGAVSTQASVNRTLGEKGIEYITDGLAVDDALQALLNTDENSEQRQLHGVSSESTYTHTGANCGAWAGHESGDDFTVAGNRLAGEDVIKRVTESYRNSDRTIKLEERLINALEAGYEAGGDKRREQLPIQSAAVSVRRTESVKAIVPYNDVRVDATETPILDLRNTYERTIEGHQDFLVYQENKEE